MGLRARRTTVVANQDETVGNFRATTSRETLGELTPRRHEVLATTTNNTNRLLGNSLPARLFRDYVFHAVDAQGRPSSDLSHVPNCLNRLDAGSTDSIQMTNREGDTVFTVTFKDIKRAMESAFNEVMGLSGTGSSGGSATGHGKGRKTTG